MEVGSCLGQVRNKGFIPWDDDIDVDMTTENYRKFLKVCKTELNKNKFAIKSYKTDKKYIRTAIRFEINHTKISLKSWDKIGMDSRIFVDIFELIYLPNNRFFRKILSNFFFKIRSLKTFKKQRVYILDPKLKTFYTIVVKFLSIRFMFFLEEVAIKMFCTKKTNWMMDNAQINGNHGGYLAEGTDEYKEDYFEGLKVMVKKNPHNFLKTLYGPNYLPWLKPADRISHHRWRKLDFGLYEKNFNLPKNYNFYPFRRGILFRIPKGYIK